MNSKTKFICSIFIVLYVGAACISAAPISALWFTSLRNLVGPATVSIGINQSWNMFQFPRKFNVSVEGQIVMTDGSLRYWTLPKMEELGTWEKYKKERFRKYAIDNFFYSSTDLERRELSLYMTQNYSIYQKMSHPTPPLLQNRLTQNEKKSNPDQVYLKFCQSFIPSPGDATQHPQWIVPLADWRCRTVYRLRLSKDEIR